MKIVRKFAEDGKMPAFLGVSIGYELIRTEGELKQALHRADQMMYENKTRRRVQR